MFPRKVIAAATGFAVASVVPFAILWSLKAARGDALPADAGTWVMAVLFNVGFAAAIIVSFALPVFLVLEKFNRVRWWTAAVAGAVAGFAMTLLLPSSDPYWTATLVSVGVASAMAFWITWKTLAGSAAGEVPAR